MPGLGVGLGGNSTWALGLAGVPAYPSALPEANQTAAPPSPQDQCWETYVGQVRHPLLSEALPRPVHHPAEAPL